MSGGSPKFDARSLQVAQAVRLLNSTPLGEVVRPYTLYRYQNRAGYRIGDGKRIDVVKFTAWLFHERFTESTLDLDLGGNGYEGAKDSANRRNRELSLLARDIAAEGWVHEPVTRLPGTTWHWLPRRYSRANSSPCRFVAGERRGRTVGNRHRAMLLSRRMTVRTLRSRVALVLLVHCSFCACSFAA